MLSAVLVASSSPAAAHPPYEREYRSVESGGNIYHLAKGYRDGIVSIDSVRIIVRDATGTILDETPAGRDIASFCLGDGCLFFRYRSAFAILPSNAYHFKNGRLVETGSSSVKALGVLAPFVEHWLGYLLGGLAVCILIEGVRAAARHRRFTALKSTLLLGVLGAPLVFVLLGFRLALPSLAMATAIILGIHRVLRAITDGIRGEHRSRPLLRR